MKPVTFNVSEPVYELFLREAKRRDRKTAELIRDAMECFLEEKLLPRVSLEAWEPLSLGAVRADWKDGAWRSEMLDAGYRP